MQAGFLLRLTQHFCLELDSLREWAARNQTLAGMYANVLDLRHEPMYRAAEMSRRALREEIIGRLILMHERHKTAGCLVPGADDIEATVSRLAGHSLPLGWALPGPLEGHRRPAEIGVNRLSEDDIKRAEEDLSTHPVAPVLSILAHFSQHFDLGEALLARIHETVTQITIVNDETSLDECIGQLMEVALVACAQRNVELASAIASTVMAMAHSARSESDTSRIIQTLLLASAALQNEAEWVEWLERQLAEAATRLPAGEPSKAFFAHLQEFKKVLKLTFGIHVRAEALASSAN